MTAGDEGPCDDAPGPMDEAHEAAVQNAERIARLFDTQFRIAGVPVGLDAIVGLIPGVGDLASGAVGVYFLNVGKRIGLPWRKRAAMAGNLALDTAIGMIPLAGDLFDVAFKAHKRNAAILRRHLDRRRRGRRAL